MGALLCNCPADSALASIPITDCPEGLGQIGKVLVQRIFSTGSTKNSLTIASTNPAVKASWTTLLAASDGTKVLVSPVLSGPTTEPGAAIEYGGGNDTLGGIPIVVGRGPTSFSANILNHAQKTIKAMKKLACENVGVYLVDQYGRIAGVSDGLDTPLKLYPIPVSAFFVGDKSLGGLENPDMNAISWRFFPNWSDNLYIVTPTDFNALTDLIAS